MINDTLFVSYLGNLDILCKVQEYKKRQARSSATNKKDNELEASMYVDHTREGAGRNHCIPFRLDIVGTIQLFLDKQVMMYGVVW